ncbi:PTR2 domain-containing protein, partial [Cephalotus follicularis]
GNETFEKLASMSLIANIAVYLKTKYNLDGILLVNVVTIWSGSSSLTAIAGAIISDTYLGRFRTLFYGSIASLLGMATMTLTAGVPQLRPTTCNEESDCPGPQKWQLGFLLSGLALLAIGAGGIRPCNIAFGADQFDTTTKKGRAQLESFFNWWYFSFTLALVVALTVVVYIQTNVSWVLGFAIPTACLVLSIGIFLIGKNTYIILKPQGSVFVDMAKVITAAFRKRNVDVRSASEQLYDPPIKESDSQTTKLTHTNKFRCLDKAAINTDSSELDDEGKPKNGWRLCTLQQVEQLKLLLGMVPVWLTGIGCFVAMDQQNTIGILQAIQMNKSVGSHFKIPPGWMGLSSMIALSIWIFIYERIYIPRAKKMTGKDKRMTMTQRINIGIVMAILCSLVAGIVEKHRREAALRNGSFESPLSITLLLPQFALSGLIEAFAAVAIMEFLTTQLPETMRTVSGAIFFLSLSAASYLNSLFVNIIYSLTLKNGKPWLGGKDLNKDTLEYFYFLIAGLGVVNFTYFNFFASRYVLNSTSKRISKCESGDEEKELEV